MTEKKKKTATAKTDQTPELSPAQAYEQDLQQLIVDWTEKALELLAGDVLALDAPEGVREIKPRPLPAVQRQLGLAGRAALDAWTVMPPMPGAAELKLPEPSEGAKARAAQIKRIEESSVHTVDLRALVNEDRFRAGLPPLPEPDEPDEVEVEPGPTPEPRLDPDEFAERLDKATNPLRRGE